MIFTNNKYTSWYYSIITNAKSRKIINDTYTERHHIIPRSLGGSNDADNLIRLTAREHFICHWLLIKMVSGKNCEKMLFALRMMRVANNYNQRYNNYITSRVYEQYKKEHAKNISRINTGRAPINKGVPMLEEQKEKLRKTASGKKQSPEHIARKIASQTGIKRKEETKQKISAKLTGLIRGPMSDKEKIKRSVALKGIQKNQENSDKKSKTLKKMWVEGTHHSNIGLTCPHCGTTMQKIIYGRWHGDRCKQKNT